MNRTTVFGRSVQQRPLTVTEIGTPNSARRVLVVGSIHGSEPAGDAIARALLAMPALPGADLWVVATINPDGEAAGTRQNADGVDLNRNFPYAWQPLGRRGAADYSGTGPLSGPEAAAAAALIGQIKPTLAIWFHQHLAVVDDSEGPIAVERRFAALVGLPLAPLTDYPGSAVSWENAVFGPTAFVVELPPGSLSPSGVARYADAIRAVATMEPAG